MKVEFTEDELEMLLVTGGDIAKGLRWKLEKSRNGKETAKIEPVQTLIPVPVVEVEGEEVKRTRARGRQPHNDVVRSARAFLAEFFSNQHAHRISYKRINEQFLARYPQYKDKKSSAIQIGQMIACLHLRGYPIELLKWQGNEKAMRNKPFSLVGTL